MMHVSKLCEPVVTTALYCLKRHITLFTFGRLSCNQWKFYETHPITTHVANMCFMTGCFSLNCNITICHYESLDYNEIDLFSVPSAKHSTYMCLLHNRII